MVAKKKSRKSVAAGLGRAKRAGRWAAKARTLLGWVIALAIVSGIALWGYRTVWLAGQLTYVTAQDGTVKHEYEVRILVANAETLILSPANGVPTYLKSEGSRFRRSEVLGTVGRQGPTVTATVAGLFFPGKDGLEGLATAQNLMNTDLAKLVPEIEDILRTQAGAEVGTGAGVGTGEETTEGSLVRLYEVVENGVLGKIVNNLEPSWAFVYLPMREGILQGDSLKFRINDIERKATVERLSDTPCGAVVRFEYFLEESSTQRVLPASWVQRSPQKGVVVPRTALQYRGEECGVYIVEAGIISFRRVRVIDENETLACVENLNTEVQVVELPRPGIEGLKVQ